MRPWIRWFRHRLETARHIRRATNDARAHEGAFDTVTCFCLFIGYPRSGHSLIGALIDAHPHAVVSHELNALRYVRAGIQRDPLYTLILQNSRAHARAGREWTGYSYAVPDQQQGSFTSLKVIGDKRGKTTTRQLQRDPALLERLRGVAGVPVRLIHVVRNPYDNIATMARRNGHGLAENVRRYFEMADAVETIRERLPAAHVLDVRHEAVIDDPRGELVRLCRFLGLEPEPGYLEDCAGIVYDRPHQSRREAAWTPELIETVRARAERVDVLRGYVFER